MKTIEIKECTKLKAIRNEVVNKLNADITKKNRNRELVYGRAVYYKLCKNLTSHSLTDIGSFIYKDHATVLHGLKVFETFELNNDYYYLEAYEEMFNAQKGKCAMCGKPSDRLLLVDHNHTTNKVRALLCFRCNIFLGYIETDSLIIKQARNYLRKH